MAELIAMYAKIIMPKPEMAVKPIPGVMHFIIGALCWVSWISWKRDMFPLRRHL